MDIFIIKSFIPEIFLSSSILLQLVLNIGAIKNIKLNFPIIIKEVYIQTLFILVSLFLLYNKLEITCLTNIFVNDNSIIFLKFTLSLISLGCIIICKKALLLQKLNLFEFFPLFLLALFALLIMLSSENLISFYLAMEMQALCFYVLASFNRTSVFSAEAGLKYFISGSFMSGVYLLGSSIIYGCLGTLDLSSINLLLSFNIENNVYLEYLLKIGFLLIIFTLLFKIASAPFHFWSPDVYEGSPLSSTIVFAILPKISLFYFFIKLLISTGIFFEDISDLLLIFGLCSILIGTFYALNQKRIKKLIIYSSIAQVGFLVSILSLQTFESFSSLFFFLFIYLITSIVLWGYVVFFFNSSTIVRNFSNKGLVSIYISDFSNFAKINLLWCVSILFIFFSIGGIPPFVGFISKMIITLQFVDSGYFFVASFLLIISAISVYYYIRIVKISFFESNKLIRTLPMHVVFNNEINIEYLLLSLFLLLLLLLFLFPTPLFLICQYIIAYLRFI
uniref:NADH dehydrogenase subunit 2 n=1 Tax=Ochromonas danica TaxID=2986 RepID=Q9G919_OCHDN|nr:NADH dehydrogenase subunit 2 [Ochromonas danica]AAG18386.1 NADH dehydrogenase subunit 2 [Ochromonas danica]